MLSVIGIFIGLALLVIFAFRGASLVWAAPICALIVALTGNLNLYEAYTDTYMQGFIGFTKSWFPTFMISAIFGRILEISGAAQSLTQWIVKKIGADKAILISLVSGGILAYGGISGFVIIFTMYPVVINLFKSGNIPNRLIPATIMVGAFQFAMSAPGAPTIQNLIPMEHFNTTAMAAPILGFLSALLMFFLAYFWLEYRSKKLRNDGEHFVEPERKVSEIPESELPNPITSTLVPFIAILIILNVLKMPIEIALISGVILAMIFNYKYITKQNDTIFGIFNVGSKSAISAVINTSAAVGFGTVVQSSPGFQNLVDLVVNIGGHPIFGLMIAVNVLAAATGSASGGLAIALDALGQHYVAIAQSQGMSLEVFHRISTLSCGGLNTMPHDGAVVTYLDYCGISHKNGYFDMLITSGLIPILVSIIAAFVYVIFGIV